MSNLLNNDMSELSKSIFTPGSIIKIFNNAISLKEERKLITVAGIYRKSGLKSYKGYYYDRLEDEGGAYSLTIITHELKRDKIESGKLVEFTGHITRGLTKEGHIRVQINLDNIHDQRQSQFTELEIQKLSIQHRKRDLGYKDVDAVIKRLIFDDKIISVGIITGESGTIDNDIKSSLGSAIKYFNIHFIKANLTSKTNLINALKKLDNDHSIDIIALSRGGGSNLEIFDNPDLCKSLFQIKKPIISAIGHEVDKMLFSRISDKSFITPTAFGIYLKEITESYIDDLKNSKAKIIEETRKLITGQFKQKVKNLEEINLKQKQANEREKKLRIELSEKEKKMHQQIISKIEKTHEETNKRLDKTIQSLSNDLERKSKELEESKGNSWKIIIWILIGLVIGLILANL